MIKKALDDKLYCAPIQDFHKVLDMGTGTMAIFAQLALVACAQD
jgi:hypothetical protein